MVNIILIVGSMNWEHDRSVDFPVFFFLPCKRFVHRSE